MPNKKVLQRPSAMLGGNQFEARIRELEKHPVQYWSILLALGALAYLLL